MIEGKQIHDFSDLYNLEMSREGIKQYQTTSEGFSRISTLTNVNRD
jgi:hypothetical protein